MKTIFIKAILTILMVSSLQAQGIDVENADALYRDSSRIIGETFFTTKSDKDSISKNTQSLIELTNLLRRVDSYAYQLSVKVKSTLTNGKVVNGEDVYQISALINIYHGISVKFNELNTYARPKNLDSFLDERSGPKINKDLLWLATYTRLYLSFMGNYNSYYRHNNLRKIIKNLIKTRLQSGQKLDELFVMISHTLESSNRREVRQYLKKYKDFRKNLKPNSLQSPEVTESLFFEIEEDRALEKILIGPVVKISNYTFTDTLSNYFGKVTNAVSGIFGNLVGKIRWRHGHFFEDQLVKNKLLNQLRPLDILFEKTPFALTDTFIPGHFGHAALYLGTEKQLREIGMWESEVIRPHQEKIRSGQIIIEAIRPGVGLTTMDKFMEIDEIAIVRQPNVLADSQEVEQIYKRALDQLGKDYDFNFDVETTDKIVCSELLFFAFGKISWPTAYILGRPTISPDNLAELTFYENTPIKFVLNYWSKKRGTIVIGNVEDLASNIGYVKNHSRSTPQRASFDKKEYRCKTVIRNNIRSGSRRSRRIQQRICKVVFEKRVYDEDKSARVQQNGFYE